MKNEGWIWFSLITLTATVAFLQYRVNKIEKKIQ
jgi:hypothetical protein